MLPKIHGPKDEAEKEEEKTCSRSERCIYRDYSSQKQNLMKVGFYLLKRLLSDLKNEIFSTLSYIFKLLHLDQIAILTHQFIQDDYNSTITYF